MSQRVDKINYYLDIAESVSQRSTCLLKKIGCVIINNDEIISTGYNGAPRGRKNCTDLGFCSKKKFFPDVRHAGYDACRAVHAEQNAIIQASRSKMLGSTLFLVGKRAQNNEYDKGLSCCQMCRKMIINAGIKYVYIRTDNREYECIDVKNWIDNDDLLNGKITY